VGAGPYAPARAIQAGQRRKCDQAGSVQDAAMPDDSPGSTTAAASPARWRRTLPPREWLTAVMQPLQAREAA
jgi:hypothetical protein